MPKNEEIKKEQGWQKALQADVVLLYAVLSIVFALVSTLLYRHGVFYMFFDFIGILMFTLVLRYYFFVHLVNFSYDPDKKVFMLDNPRIKSSKVHYEKVIYAKKTRKGFDYWLTLEVWFGRQLVVFTEKISSLVGRTEEVYEEPGMKALYWTKMTGKIDKLSEFIDGYNLKKDMAIQ